MRSGKQTAAPDSCVSCDSEHNEDVGGGLSRVREGSDEGFAFESHVRTDSNI